MKHFLADCRKGGGWRRWTVWILGGVLLIAAVSYAWISLSAGRSPVRLVVYALSTQQEVLTQGIFPAFEQEWEEQTGRELVLEGVFGPSGTLAGQINLGAPADLTLFSNAQHVTWLQIGRRVQKGTEPVMVGCTPMVILTRPGNPAGVAEFADLAQPGLRVLHPDPRSSGAGEWAVLAEYGSSLLESGDRAAAEERLGAIWRNVRLLAPSARSTLSLFELGAGDAMVTYEQDARLALDRGVALEIVVPSRTIVAQHVAVIVDDNVTSAERPAARAFIDFLMGDTGQEILNRYHLRPVDLDDELFPELAHPFSVEDLGGWSQAYAGLVETLWQGEIEPYLELEPSSILLDGGGR
jgi:ABC-type sulfate transport system substrate-binding protein